ncbi:metallo-dependent hydrolase, subgroup D [Campylobacter pinnipediorum subsp. pinnipediorum]|uniref:aminofutalosine deaminase family hydrolase n=1 Tax=Campylobacter pinnipediorum TaxID=1965231 RepID=UPI00099535E4|nr:metal-dependent hydrolase [Campylobacter pinnipediorum]AQW84728.1 metallo-dependent hydrolase, subgroup D [Campylobacter pinnipediorum subsp. pinnipediorum]OPA79594.1 chlorohydrolase [Campylobacter pinnipediorum subsp. pinnipediorum]
MKILKAKYLIDENLNFLKDHAIVFQKHIIDMGDADTIIKKYNNAEVIDMKNSIIAPAFVNTHVHLEFSANKSSLVYGDFIVWLGSIVKNSAFLVKKGTPKVIEKAIKSMLKSGIASVGAISSFGNDIKSLANSPLNVVMFNEILGSNELYCEQSFDLFLKRFNESVKYKSERFIPAMAIHSPYSVHPKLLQKSLEFAKKEKLVLSTHFLESKYEKQWLEEGKGNFENHLKKFVDNPKPMYNPDEFFANFKGLKTLFTHCVYASNLKDFDKNHSITHCSRSNRLLGDRRLDLKSVLDFDVSLNIGTDGLSSNLSLNMFEEIRAAIFTHCDLSLNELCKKLFKAATIGGANALSLNNGVLKKGYNSDIMVLKAPQCDESSLLTQMLLQTKNVKKLYIGGDECNF